MIGTTISHYHVLEKLGAGGMGVLYKAQDSRLGRFVALKFLPDEYADDPQLRERFHREARAASTLNHPNVCTIYDIGEENGRIFIAMEFLDGMTLKELMRRGLLELEHSIEIALQVVNGLHAAHNKGIIHRDIKAANIFISGDHGAKILDFGLAKIATPRHAKAAVGLDATRLGVGEDPTAIGGTVGTLPYMSPEQALGKPLDTRTDLFSFGVMLYEMVTGQMPFQGDTTGVLLLEIVQGVPESPRQFNPAIPDELQRIIEKCLEKHREARYQLAAEIREDLTRLQRDVFHSEAVTTVGANEARHGDAVAIQPGRGSHSGARASTRLRKKLSTTPAGRQRPRLSRKKLIWIAATVSTLIMAVLVIFWTRSPAIPAVASVVQLTDDGEAKWINNNLLTDGSRIYFNEGTIGRLKIAEAAVTGGATGIISSPIPNPQLVALAPAGSALLVLQGRFAGGGKSAVWEFPLPAGDPHRLGEIEAQDATFSPDGHILFSQGGDLYVAERDGSNPRKILGRIPGLIGQPTVSPDGEAILFTVYPEVGLPAIFESNIDGSGLHAIVPASDTTGFCCAEWMPDGRYIVFQSQTRGQSSVWILPMPGGWRQRRAQPIELTVGALSYTGPIPSADRKQIFAAGAKRRGELVRYDHDSNQFVPFLSGISAFNPTFSRDGKWVAYASYPDNTLWRSRTDGSERLQLTFLPQQVEYPFISPDGKQVVYGYKGNVYVISMNGGTPRMVVSDGTSFAANWSADGNTLVFANYHFNKHPELQFLDMRTGKRSVVPDSRDVMGGQWLTEDVLIGAHTSLTDLLLFDVRTQHWSDLVRDMKPGTVVNWAHSPDYKYLYYTTGGTDPKVIRVRISDRKLETVASLKDLRLAPGPDGNTQISVAPDGSPIFTHDIGTQEIYALSLKWP